jgi:hypothetical protein
MTSNIGSEYFRKLTTPLGFFGQQVGVEQVHGEIMRELERRFAPEFRNRIDEVVLFAPLSCDDVQPSVSTGVSACPLGSATYPCAPGLRGHRTLPLIRNDFELMVSFRCASARVTPR